MTDNLQLQTLRMTDASSGSLIATSLADIEHCLRVIFKIAADTPIAQAMEIEADGDVTLSGTLILAAAPTSNLHAATKKYVDDSSGGGGVSHVCGVYAVAYTIPASTQYFVEWGGITVEEGSSDQWDSGDPTKVVCKSAGDYLIQGVVRFGLNGQPYHWSSELYKNGGKVVENILGYYGTNYVSSDDFRSFAVMLTLAENDYLQLRILNSNGGFTGDVGAGSASGLGDGTYFYITKVG